MTVKLTGLVCGWITAPTGAFIAGESGMMQVPVLSFLIEHAKGRALFDTGMSNAMRQGAEDVIGRRGAATYHCEIPTGMALDEQLKARDIDPAAIDTIVLSHLHFDHAGGNDLAPNARIIVQAREAEAARQTPPPTHGYNASGTLKDRDVMEIDGEFDVFGDGSAVLFPTYGHTPGHQSLKLACDDGVTVLAGDCCYFHRTLRDLKLPGHGHDLDEQRRSVERLRALEDAGARIIAGHDPEQWPAPAH